MLKACIAVAALAATFSQAQAADPFTDAVQQAYAPYRVALFKTSSGPLTEARDAVEKAGLAWAGVVAIYPQAQIPYAGDSAFNADLAHVATVYKKAVADLELQNAAAAHETLEEVRDILASLRQRNGVVVFSDHMNAYHSQMETVLGDGPALLKTSHGLFDLTQQAGVLAYLAGRLDREAPARLKANDEFPKLLTALKQSVTILQNALATGDIPAVQAALAGLKAPYARMFVKFG